MTNDMELVVDEGGDVRCIYGEELDLRELGKLQITRASHVEPDAEGCWWADMGPSGGPMLGPYGSRSEALGAERDWLWRTTQPTLLGDSQTPPSCGTSARCLG
jgi:hypothetical protein